MTTQILAVAAGGALGALCRLGLSALAVRIVGAGFPWGTLVANLTGCFLIGVAVALIEYHNLLGDTHRLFFMTGILGALTTFSTFALDTVTLARSGAWFAAGTNLVITNVACVVLVLVGLWVGKRL